MPERLRRETATLHSDVETTIGLPGTVRTNADYRALLGRLLSLHSSLEKNLEAVRWRSGWKNVGLDLTNFSRVGLLRSDLANLGETEPAPSLSSPGPATFGGALGSLYVMEGSSLGGRMLSPAVKSVLGDVPTRFYDSDGRHHPQPWRAVQRALRQFEDGGGDAGHVIIGARDTFSAFGRHLASTLWSSAR